MAHFAELDADGVVLNIVVVDNKDCNDLPFPESEAVGQDYLETVFGGDKTRWKQTSYNKNFRRNYACIGERYVPEDDAFMPAKYNPSWVFNKDTYSWEPPLPKPTDATKVWFWDELTQQWMSNDTKHV